VAIVGNVLRVLAIVLVTVAYGAEAAQGALHELAGMIVFVAALGLIVLLDGRFVRRFAQRREALVERPQDPPPASARAPRLAVAALAAAAMAATAVAAPLLKPTASNESIDLERLVPPAFGGWTLEPTTDSVPPAPDVEANLARLYHQVLERTYVNAQGERMMLTIAHGGDQGDSLKAHRQESCYAAQGFEIRGLERSQLTADRRDIPVTRMLAVRGERSEPVTYWFTMGDRVVLGRLERLRTQVAYGLSGRVPDGVLVRVSSLSSRPAQAYAAQAAFVAALLQPLGEREATRLAGTPREQALP
jgi:EpsI family protein